MPRKKKPEAITVTREPDSEVQPRTWEALPYPTPPPALVEILADAQQARLREMIADLVSPVDGAPVGYTALLAPLRSVYPVPILPEPPITDTEWSAMVEAIRASEEDVIALAPPLSCCDEVWTGTPGEPGSELRFVVNEGKLRACADALRVTACALGVGLTFYPRKASTHTLTIPKLDKGGMRKRRPDEATVTEVPAALMVRRMS